MLSVVVASVVMVVNGKSIYVGGSCDTNFPEVSTPPPVKRRLQGSYQLVMDVQFL